MSLVVIGNFDGVHLGHRHLLESAAREAERLGFGAKLLTFVPHPAEVLGRRPPPLLTRHERKRELIAGFAPSVEVVAQKFDLAFAAQSPEAFVDWLASLHGARRVVVGQNFRFGKDRAGDFDALVRLGAERGISARYEALVGDDAGAWSSTRVRAAIAAGNMAEAERMLGRKHMLIGRVESGKRLGRTLGFPTANLTGVLEMLPPHGVYAVLVDRRGDGGGPLARGAMSIGTNPTTDVTDSVKVEVYLLDWEGDLYGAELGVSIAARIRGEERFGSMEALVAQMHADVAAARKILNGSAPHPPGGTSG